MIFALFSQCCTHGIPPRCQLYNGACGRLAAVSVMLPSSWSVRPIPLVPKFACASCYFYLLKWWRTPIKGIDRPANADEDWRPSLMDMMRFAQIAITFEERDKNRQTPPQSNNWQERYWAEYDKKFTPAQREQARNHRYLMRAYVGGAGNG